MSRTLDCFRNAPQGNDVYRTNPVERRTYLRILTFTVLLVAGGCSPVGQSIAETEVRLELTPNPPRVGTAQLALTLTDAAGQPLETDSLEVEGNMNHAGMVPVFATLRPTTAGRYEGSLEFTMAGDWFLLVSGQLADGRRVDQKIDVPGVQHP